VTVIGEIPVGGALRRDGARPGDDVWLSGATGEAAIGLAVLEKRLSLPEPPRSICIARLERPEPRLVLGLRLRSVAHSAIDVSDGLVADLGHIAQASKVGMEVREDWLPSTSALASCPDARFMQDCRLGGGDDYELAFTAPASQRDVLKAVSGELDLPLSRIGTVLDEPTGEVRVIDARGNRISVSRPGYDHFR
jgi:thiamine-monophosphate kinase